MDILEMLEYGSFANWCAKARAQFLEESPNALKFNGESVCSFLKFFQQNEAEIIFYTEPELYEKFKSVVDNPEASKEENRELTRDIAHAMLHIIFCCGATWAIENRLQDQAEAAKHLIELNKGLEYYE